MFDTCWIMMTMLGLQVMIKGKKKTAFMATYWKDGKQIDVDMGALEMRLPDGRVVPHMRRWRGDGWERCSRAEI